MCCHLYPGHLAPEPLHCQFPVLPYTYRMVTASHSAGLFSTCVLCDLGGPGEVGHTVEQADCTQRKWAAEVRAQTIFFHMGEAVSAISPSWAMLDGGVS
jgi:hypothetical protein